MKSIIMTLMIMSAFTSSTWATGAFEDRPITTLIWSPTGYTLHEGEFKIGLGTTIGTGITDNIQLSTNILGFIFQNYNLDLKFNLIKTPEMAIAAGINYSRFHMARDDYDSDKNDAFTSVSPYIALSKPLNKRTTLLLLTLAQTTALPTGLPLCVPRRYFLTNSRCHCSQSGCSKRVGCSMGNNDNRSGRNQLPWASDIPIPIMHVCQPL